jgi:hypothetical protein
MAKWGEPHFAIVAYKKYKSKLSINRERHQAAVLSNVLRKRFGGKATDYILTTLFLVPAACMRQNQC